MLANGQSLAVLKGQTWKAKLDNMFTDYATGANYADVFRYMNLSGIACSQHGDWAGFTAYLSWKWPHIKYMDLCHCILPIPKNPFPNTMQEFVFPTPGLCKKLWRKTTLFKTDSVSLTAQPYTTPGDPTTWVEFRGNGLREAYRPLTAEIINDLGSAYSVHHSFFFTCSWKKDPLLEAKSKNECWIIGKDEI